MTDPTPTGQTRRDRAAYLRRWVGWTTLGESLGFAVAATTAAVLLSAGVDSARAYPLIVAAGAVEGALLGAGQAAAMRSLRVPTALLVRWPMVTAAAAAAAWSLGMLPSTIPGVDWTRPIWWPVAGLLGLVLLASIPGAQLLLLRHVVRRSWRWLPANLLGWLAGISWTFAPSPLVSVGTPTSRIVAVYVLAGVLMALTVAVATGACWVGWLAHGDLRRDAAA